jgi:hypothetical protein
MVRGGGNRPGAPGIVIGFTAPEEQMGRYLLLWMLGIPLPILALIWVFGGLHG